MGCAAATDRAYKEMDASKIITFHSRVALAEDFAKNEPRGIAHYLDGFDVRHVNGKQNSSARSDAISAFAAADIAPQVTWGTSPENVVPITGSIPDPEHDARDDD